MVVVVRKGMGGVLLRLGRESFSCCCVWWEWFGGDVYLYFMLKIRFHV